jgi:hypothetical protein
MKPHVVALLFASSPVAAAAPDHSLLGAWRITHGVVAPFAVEAPIDGDPFTDSQEFPTRFAVREGQGDARTVDVPVDFADGYSARRVFYRLRKIGGGGWRVDDLLYAHGGTLREALVAPN